MGHVRRPKRQLRAWNGRWRWTGIHNVIKLLEDIEDGKLNDIDYVEALACTGGCVGGPLAAENNFVAESRLKRLCKGLPYEGAPQDGGIDPFWDRPLVYRPVMNLDQDIQKAMLKIGAAGGDL